MKARLPVITGLVCAAIAAGVLHGQEQPAAQSRIIGEVTATDAASRRIDLKSDKGDTIAVALEDKTLYLRVPPGEKDLKKAARITQGDIGVGDRVLARGRLSEDQKTITAAAVIVMTKADLAQKHQRDREEWQKRGTAGTVTAINPESKQITLSTGPRDAPKPIIVDAAGKVDFTRYAPDSVRFSDARPSSFGELSV